MKCEFRQTKKMRSQRKTNLSEKWRHICLIARTKSVRYYTSYMIM